MCNGYQQRVKRGLYDDAFSQINVPLTWTDPEPNRPPDRPLKPTNRAPMIRALDPGNPAAGLEGVERRWCCQTKLQLPGALSAQMHRPVTRTYVLRPN